MQKILLFAFMLLGSSQLVAQVPGYLGKRLSATFNFQSMLAFNGPTYKNKGQEEFDSDGTAFSNRFELNASYTLSREFTVVVAVERSRTGVGIDLTNPQNNDYVKQFFQLRNTSFQASIRKFSAT